MVRIILVDDQAMVRQALRWELRLEPDLDVVGEADNGVQGVALARTVQPDLVIMDVEMPVMDGIQAAGEIHALLPGCAILLLTIHNSTDMQNQALAAGACVLLEKGSPQFFRATLHELAQLVKTS